jgi:1,4-alpha-glucan branching enzyme
LVKDSDVELMHSIDNYHPHRPKAYSAKNMVKPVPFTCFAPQARAVFVLGDFNDWDPSAHPMRRQPDGAWRLDLPLSHGHHHYRFLVDGKPVLDPRAHGTARDHQGEKVSLVSVS